MRSRPGQTNLPATDGTIFQPFVWSNPAAISPKVGIARRVASSDVNRDKLVLPGMTGARAGQRETGLVRS